MHTQEHQKILDSMTPEEKVKRTSIRSFKQRQHVTHFKHWFLVDNEFPHVDRGDLQKVLYESRTRRSAGDIQGKRYELQKIFSMYNFCHIHMNPVKDMSVPGRLHFHIYR